MFLKQDPRRIQRQIQLTQYMILLGRDLEWSLPTSSYQFRLVFVTVAPSQCPDIS